MNHDAAPDDRSRAHAFGFAAFGGSWPRARFEISEGIVLHLRRLRERAVRPKQVFSDGAGWANPERSGSKIYM